jgi:hypothetical protein
MSLRRRARGIEFARRIVSDLVEDDVDERLVKFETDVAPVWMLCTSAALLGAMARGVHWI